MRKVILAAFAVTGALVFGSGQADARTYRYCLVEGFEPGPGTCYYDTYAQCMASASGRRAYCQVNPFVSFAEQPRRKVRRHRHYR